MFLSNRKLGGTCKFVFKKCMCFENKVHFYIYFFFRNGLLNASLGIFFRLCRNTGKHLLWLFFPITMTQVKKTGWQRSFSCDQWSSFSVMVILKLWWKIWKRKINLLNFVEKYLKMVNQLTHAGMYSLHLHVFLFIMYLYSYVLILANLSISYTVELWWVKVERTIFSLHFSRVFKIRMAWTDIINLLSS